ncbi:MAG: hypothetical protein PHG89_11665 [Gallionella sp.]|nr:hypothetical protein [Gallionella sp.]
METLTCSECSKMAGIERVFCLLTARDITPESSYCEFFQTRQGLPRIDIGLRRRESDKVHA